MTADRPEFAAPNFVGCYRHPDRTTGISCQRCGKPICGECMEPASVGFQCPQCIGRGRGEVRQPRTRFGGSLGRGTMGDAPATKVLMGITVVVFLINFGTGGFVNALLAQSNYAIAGGQLWRLLTVVFTTSGLISTLLNLLVLFIVGRALEGVLGSSRFVVLYVLSGLGGATVLFVAGPLALGTAGGSGSVLGLLAANAAIKLRSREDVKPDLILLALLVGVNFAIGSVYGGLAQLGAAVTGLLGGLVLAYAPRARRTPVQVLGLTGIVALCLAAALAKIALIS
jgi:membrane associated rhomboid family serine protease